MSSPFTHLARSVLGSRYWRREAWFAMITGYFDESMEQWVGEDGPHDFTFVCGFATTVNRWEIFEDEWKKYLARYDVSDFHMKDFSQSVGEFSKWKDDEFRPIRNQFMADAAKIIRDTASYGFIALLPFSAFDLVNEFYTLREQCGSPYGIVGRACCDMIRLWQLDANLPVGEAEFVFADGCPDKEGLMRALTTLTPNFPYPIFKPAKTQKPTAKCPEGKRAVVQLQAADYLAYEIRKMFADQIKTSSGRDFRKSFKAVASISTARLSMDIWKLLTFCQEREITLRNGTHDEAQRRIQHFLKSHGRDSSR